MNVPAAPRKIVISGSYGGLNLGDEAILQAITSELRKSLPVEITVLSRDAADTRARHQVNAIDIGTLSRREAQDLISEFDLFILGGGGLLYDEDTDMYLRDVYIAHEVGTPVMVYGIGAGPLVDRARRERVRAAFQAAATITVRDRQSRQLLDDIGVDREITVTADPAFLLTADPTPLRLEDILQKEAIDSNARMIGVSVREPGPAAPDLEVEHYHRLIANAADYLIDRFEAEVVFFPLERRRHDVQHCHSVVGQMGSAEHARVLRGEYLPGQLISLLSRFEFTLGMRLHFLLFSALAGVPFMALPYAAKVVGFIEALHISPPPFSRMGQVSAGQLIAIISRAWGQRETIRTQIRSHLPELVQRARENHTLALKLLSASECNTADVAPSQ